MSPIVIIVLGFEIEQDKMVETYETKHVIVSPRVEHQIYGAVAVRGWTRGLTPKHPESPFIFAGLVLNNGSSYSIVSGPGRTICWMLQSLLPDPMAVGTYVNSRPLACDDD